MSHDHTTSQARALAENHGRRASLLLRRVLSSISTNLAATRVSKPEENKRRRHDLREPGQENDPVRLLSSSVLKTSFSEGGLIRHHFDAISLSAHDVTDSEEDNNTPRLMYSDALNHIYDDDDEEDEEEDDLENLAQQQPQEPKWNRAIFDELKYVMRKYSDTIMDENDEDTYDVTMVAEYAPEIFNYLHELEHKMAPDANYMDDQDELKWEMRSVLVDWVVQVHQRFNLLPETLYLTINYIDRFLSRRKVSLSRFQLVGAVALFLAAKYEEINCPTVQEVAYMADNAYTVQEFLKAELFLIGVLEFEMGWPGPMSFLRRTSKADDYDYETRTLAKYFLEITIMDHRFVASQPSWLAAGAHYLLRKMLNKGAWTELHVFYSGYTEEQLKPLARVFMDICTNAETSHKAIYEKYQERKYRRSSLFVQEFLRAMRQEEE
ncbi:A/B/D/E cyclin [Metschnikowia bicuspidata var. bicuspidata NRRL YB-4993]|uniref:A/B/D/E cyclin n=1 Tax=Metschnikowia bicuspidata var. bicuspidata NRRL YB-4993 TaxID=869754 RepID=A0A1A0HGL6_9ASCO|nr:A/B/D/E cyclin [Metschnikowia bicuspidata var. bicuspidata NRRL YB-4993]OBA23022.1 A/B/D/E cyclin [Metschnikowia bicuspidata var. bicuspidata NRRL YB-4993]